MMEHESKVSFTFFISLINQLALRPHLPTFTNWVKELHAKHSPLSTDTALVVFRLLLPEEDTERKYSLQETKLARYLADVLCVSTRKGARGENLRNWKEGGREGCLGKEIEQLLNETWNGEQDTRSLQEIDTLLCELASMSPFSSSSVRCTSSSKPRRTVRAILSSLFSPTFSTLSPLAGAFLTQTILKDIRPLLCPLSSEIASSSGTIALLKHKSNETRTLTKEDIMNVWDPSGRMLRAYRVRANITEALFALEKPVGKGISVEPKVGVPVMIPKSMKGTSSQNALQQLVKYARPTPTLPKVRRSRKVWIETKYDGERAQIHVQVSPDGSSSIRIFSKSRRESTWDRIAVHEIIRDALCLPLTRLAENENQDPHESSTKPGKKEWPSKVITNIILEAEMVAWDEVRHRVAEFHYIRPLIQATALGPRRDRRASVYTENSDSTSTYHLALIFFDLLYLNTTSLLSSSYSHRTTLLRSVLRVKPGHAMLAERGCIDVSCHGDNLVDYSCVRDLEGIFKESVESGEEGVVLKADDSPYGACWVKLKKDYIPGYGDCVDMVLLGASWEKERGRELRVGTSVYTTFFIGALTNGEEVGYNPRTKPHFQIVLTSMYGLSREKLEDVNYYIDSSDPVSLLPPKQRGQIENLITLPGLSYTFTLDAGVTMGEGRRPRVMLRDPVLVELFGGGFVKSSGSEYYTPRWPRLTKVHRPFERRWEDGVSLDELQAIARKTLQGTEMTFGLREDRQSKLKGSGEGEEGEGLEGKGKGKEMDSQEVWVRSLWKGAQERGSDERVGTGAGIAESTRAGLSTTVQQLDQSAALTPTPQPTLPIATIGMNSQEAWVSAMFAEGSRRSLAMSEEPRSISLKRTRSSLGVDEGWKSLDVVEDREQKRLKTMETVTNVVTTNATCSSLREVDLFSQLSTSAVVCSSVSSINTVQYEESTISTLPTSFPTDFYIQSNSYATLSTRSPFVNIVPAAETLLKYAAHPLAQYLASSAVYIALPPHTPHPLWRVPTNEVVMQERRLSTLEALFMACGWNTGPTWGGCKWAERGVVFVDDSRGEVRWQNVLSEVLRRKAVLAVSDGNPRFVNRHVPIVMFGLSLLSRECLDDTNWSNAEESSIEAKAVCNIQP